MTDDSPWEDLGNPPKDRKREKTLARIPPTPLKKLEHESDEFRETRFLKNLELISEIYPQAKVDADGMISVKINDKIFDFWPYSDCYHIHSVGLYGTGIPKLCMQIKQKLLIKKELPNEIQNK